jgi:hypothetical protein
MLLPWHDARYMGYGYNKVCPTMRLNYLQTVALLTVLWPVCGFASDTCWALPYLCLGPLQIQFIANVNANGFKFKVMHDAFTIHRWVPPVPCVWTCPNSYACGCYIIVAHCLVADCGRAHKPGAAAGAFFNNKHAKRPSGNRPNLYTHNLKMFKAQLHSHWKRQAFIAPLNPSTLSCMAGLPWWEGASRGGAGMPVSGAAAAIARGDAPGEDAAAAAAQEEQRLHQQALREANDAEQAAGQRRVEELQEEEGEGGPAEAEAVTSGAGGAGGGSGARRLLLENDPAHRTGDGIRRLLLRWMLR